jgi:hypothetical protein
VNGQSITGPYDTTTIWDLSDDGYYYTDAWLYTGTNGAAVPQCALKTVTKFLRHVGCVAPVLPVIRRPGQRRHDADCQDKFQRILPAPPISRVRDGCQHTQQTRYVRFFEVASLCRAGTT